MELDGASVAMIADAEVAKISNAAIRARVAALRIVPRRELRPWNYGAPQEYPCWLVLEDTSSHVGIAYCISGFGPKTPWGLLWMSGTRKDMGDDSGWFTSLAEAVESLQ